MRLKFIQDYTPKAKDAEGHTKDQIVDFPDDVPGRASAQHYLNRSVAVELKDEDKKAGPKAKADAPQAIVPNAPLKG